MDLWYSSVYKAFMATCFVTFLISFFSTGNISLGSSIAGYCLLILSIMMILIILFNHILKLNLGSFEMLITILTQTGPFILMLGTIGFLMYLAIYYMNPIIAHQVSDNYYNFSNISIILILLQVFIVYKNITNDNFKTTGKISKITACILYLLSLLTISCSIILYIILKYFRTDG
jgi:hypothetical protein